MTGIEDRPANGITPASYEDAVPGFRSHWCPAMFSSHVRETEITTLRLLGEDIPLKRGGRPGVRPAGRVPAPQASKFSAKPECYTKHSIT